MRNTSKSGWWIAIGIVLIAIIVFVLPSRQLQPPPVMSPIPEAPVDTTAQEATQPAPVPSPAPKPAPKPEEPPYPRLANYYLTGTITPDQAAQLAQWDVVVLGLENQVSNPGSLKALEAANPDIIRLCYVATNEFATKHQSNPPWDALWDGMDESDWLYTPDGEHASFWQGAWSFNLTQASTAEKIVRFALSEPERDLWEGVFYDNVWGEVTWYLGGNVDANRDGQPDTMSVFSERWIANEEAILKLTHKRGHGRYVVMNGAGSSIGFGVANGRMYEGFPNTLPSLGRLLDEYLLACANSVEPRIVILHAEGNEYDDEQRMFAFCFCLLGDGYFAYDHGPREDKTVPGDTGWHDCLWWYPEYDTELGKAQDDAFYHEASRVWARQFEEGIVFCNISDTSTEFDIGNRSANRTIVLSPRSGQIVLWRDLAPA